MPRISHIFVLFCSLFAWACNTYKPPGLVENKPVKSLFYTNSIVSITLYLGEVEMPIKMSIAKNEKGEYYGKIHNAEEIIETKPFQIVGDSIFIESPVFNSLFKGVVKRDASQQYILSFSGVWRNHMKPGIYEIPFVALVGENKSVVDKNELKEGSKYYTPKLNGKWEVTFSPGTKEEYKSIGLFTSKSDSPNKITGTFLTETGDYRFLEGEGNFIDSVFLTCFDGSHAFYFDFFPSKNSDTLRGMFYSGKHWKEPWIAVRNESFELTHPDSLTFIKKGFNSLTFSFPNLSGQTIDFPSDKFNNKVTIIQIMGSWCPNCMDETKVLTNFHKKYNSKGLEVIALCYEPSADFDKNVKAVSHFKSYFGSDFDFLIAGKSNTSSAAESLPMLNHIMSFPTTIFIDKNGEVRKIFTGFYGPSTGSYYQRYIEQTEDFIIKLLHEGE